MKIPGIVTIEILGVRSKRRTIILHYGELSAQFGIHESLWLDELAKQFRAMADWLESLILEIDGVDVLQAASKDEIPALLNIPKDIASKYFQIHNEADLRILVLARRFADIHGNDSDDVGEMARALLKLIDMYHPEVLGWIDKTVWTIPK